MSDKNVRRALARLHQRLATQAPGRVTDEELLEEVESTICKCWDNLAGSTAHKMSSYKLDRMERVRWDPPFVCLVIERHGGFVRGSRRAELQEWAVNLEKGTAEASTTGHRQLGPSEPRVDVKPIADEISTLIFNGQDNDRLKWGEGRRWVRVLIGKIEEIDAWAKQTRDGRRKRFHVALEQRLTARGWQKVPGKAKGTYAAPPSA